MTKSFLIQRLGNKTNDIKFFKHLLPKEGIKNVVEPFGGSFAVIRNEYKDDKYKKYVNDSDNNLYYVYTHIEELIEGFNLTNDIFKENISLKEKKEKTKNLNINDKIKKYIIETVCVGPFIKTKNIDNTEDDKNFIKSINFTNEDAFKIIDDHKYNKNTFIFLDPPYLFSDNSTYEQQQGEADMTEFIFKFLNVLKDKKVKAKIMLVINSLSILKSIYKDFIKCEYVKIYQIAKKKMPHIVICNY